ncbi:MAG: histidinol-phosphate transaminase [Desulfobacterales bacterium]|nr:histidinol-phosphate transaminase [Desulfobacterales bacterium]
MKLSVPDYVWALDPYEPGKPMEEVEREYGIKDPVKLASNENPLGPSPRAAEAIKRAIGNLNRYPDGGGFELLNAIAKKLDVRPENILLGNGSDEIIGMLAHTMLGEGDEAILPDPSFLMYDIVVKSVGAKPVYVPLKNHGISLGGFKEKITEKTRMIFINNPNNPTGTIVSKGEFEEFLNAVPEDVVIVIDEAYIEFVRDKSCLNGLDFLDIDRPIVILRTFSKIYGLAGLRIGYGIMPEAVTEMLNRIRMPFNASSLAQVGALAALDDDAFFKKTIKLVHEELDYLYGELDEMGVTYFPTQTNFFLIDVKRDANAFFEEMLQQGIIVRSMVSYGFPEYIRVNMGTHEENMKFIEALKKVF